jgi:hypothetical protein
LLFWKSRKLKCTYLKGVKFGFHGTYFLIKFLLKWFCSLTYFEQCTLIYCQVTLLWVSFVYICYHILFFTPSYWNFFIFVILPEKSTNILWDLPMIMLLCNYSSCLYWTCTCWSGDGPTQSITQYSTRNKTSTPSVLKLLSPLIFLVMFDHSSYSKY